MTAFIVVRDGGADLIARHEGWIRGTLRDAFKAPSDPVHRVRQGLQFNSIAIAFAATVLLLRNHFSIQDVVSLLESAGDENPAAAHGFAACSVLLSQMDERLPRAVLRSALRACIKPHRNWRKPEAEYETRLDEFRNGGHHAIQREIEWLEGKRDEPEWPELPTKAAKARRRFRQQDPKRKPVDEPLELDIYADDQAASLWLGGARSLFDASKRPWLRDVVKAYGPWTFIANGSQLDGDDDVEGGPKDWNDVFFDLLAHCLVGLSASQVDEIALVPITRLPDRTFFDVARTFQRAVDGVYFNDLALTETDALRVRAMLF